MGETVWPVKSKEGRNELYAQIAKLPPLYRLFGEIAVATGWRTTDICRLRFDDIKNGKAKIVIAKQTKAAGTRAMMAFVRNIFDQRLETARANADHQQVAALTWYQGRDLVAGKKGGKPKWVPRMNLFMAKLLEEQPELQTSLDLARGTADDKVDTKKLTPEILAQIKRLKERDSANQWVFAKQFTRTRNRGSLEDGPISRQSIWKVFKKIGEILDAKGFLSGAFSAYSLRKTVAYARYQNVNKTGRNGLEEARKFLGHSNAETTLKYLMIGEEENEVAQEEHIRDEGFEHYFAQAA